MIPTNDISAHYLLKAVESINRQIVVISPDYTILAFTPPPDPENITKPESMLGRICHEALFGRAHPCPGCPATEVKKNNAPAFKHLQLKKELQDGHTHKTDPPSVPFCFYAYPIPATDNPAIQTSIVILDFDLPALFQYDEKRNTSNAFLRNLIHSAADGVIAADMKGKIIIFNKAATQITGYSKQDAIDNLNIREIYPPNEAQKIMKKMRSSEYGGEGVVKGHRQIAIRKDGSTVPISLNASIVYEGGNEVASIGFFHDLTEAKRLESEIEKMQIQLLQSEKMSSLGKLAAGVAHQLNNPLGGITLFTQLILEEHTLDDDVRSDLLRIQQDAERCSAIVKELLEFARQTKREVKPQNINTVVARTLFLLKNQTLFQNIKIVEEYDDGIPQIPMDVQQLNHVFMNIILNAADAMEGDGTLTIQSRLCTDTQTARIVVADTGPGIPDSIMNNIFEPFFTTKEEGKGTGLGLSMAYGIIESHNGKIVVENRDTGGTCFTIALPLKKITHSE